MKRTLKLSRRASLKLVKLLDYLESEWSIKVQNDFVLKFDKKLEHLAEFPESHPKSDIIKGLFRFVVTKQTTVYYKYDKKSVIIVTLFDTRQNHKKLKKDTK